MAQRLKEGQQILVGLLLCFGFQITSSAAVVSGAFEAAPDWVKPVPAFQSASTPVDSEYALHEHLSDVQINALKKGDSQTYNASEFSLTNEFGVESFSTLDISFDPAYQTVKLHELLVNRGGQIIDKAQDTEVTVSEKSINTQELSYDSVVTLSAVVADLRVGDVVRYAYTISGDNPVFDGYREFSFQTEVWTPLDRQHVRVLAPSEQPLNRRVRGDRHSVSVKDKLGVQELVYEQRDVKKISAERNVPIWHEERGTLVLSDLESWQDVATWGRSLFQLPKQASDEVIKLADNFRAENDSVEEQIGAALTWVQSEIGTVSVDLTRSSQAPASPEETLRRGFGSSSDKAQLLIAILHKLDVDATVALVNTARGLEAGDYPYRLLAFNHALVHIERDGESHFIDPTRESQSGALGDIFEPNYGRALVLSDDAVSLTAMSDKRSAVRLAVHKELTLPGVGGQFVRTSMKQGEQVDESVAALTVVSKRYGLLAEQIRNNLQEGASGDLERMYLDYYQVLFPSITAVESIEHQDSANNLSTSTERYSIEDFWNTDEKVGEHRWLYADDIIANLDLPRKIDSRRHPYELTHPIDIQETWVVPVSADIRMYLQEASVSNEWLTFSKSAVINEAESLATITFNYSTLKNEVAAQDVDRYVASVEQVNDDASFYLQHAPSLAAAREATVVPWNTPKVKFWVLFIGMLYFTGWWLHFMKRYRKSMDYYSDES
ncbi:MAG: DUF3857 domain-containing protein [Granulosicoccus sp.]